jgi:hypothetical protein
MTGMGSFPIGSVTESSFGDPPISISRRDSAFLNDVSRSDSRNRHDTLKSQSTSLSFHLSSRKDQNGGPPLLQKRLH